MELTEAQYESRRCFPRQRGQRQAGEHHLNAILHVRSTASGAGCRHGSGDGTRCTCACTGGREKGVMDRVLEHLQERAGAHPWMCRAGARQHQHTRTGRGREEKTVQAIGKSRGGWNTKRSRRTTGRRWRSRCRRAMPRCARRAQAVPDARRPARSDAVRPPWRSSRERLVMDRAYEDDATRALARNLGFDAVVPPKSTARNPGSTTGSSTSGATRSSVCSAASRASGGCSPGSTSSTGCSSASSSSRSSSRHGLVNLV